MANGPGQGQTGQGGWSGQQGHCVSGGLGAPPGGDFPASLILSRVKENPDPMADPEKLLFGFFDPAKGSDAFSLEDLYPGVRQTILIDLA